MVYNSPGRVSVRVAVVRVPTLVQRVAEHVAAQGHAAAYQYARYLAEVDVGQPVPTERERAAVADRDVAGLVFAEPLGEAVQPVVGRLQPEPFLLAEALGQRQLTVPQEVQHVPEQHAVAVDEIPTLAVLGQRVEPTAETVGEQRRLRLHQRGHGRRVEHAANVQVDHLIHRNNNNNNIYRATVLSSTVATTPHTRAPAVSVPVVYDERDTRGLQWPTPLYRWCYAD